MGPRVVRRLPKKSAGRSSRSSSTAPRGPKNRPVFRLWEHATWRVRMRTWCNCIKSSLLGSIHDPARPQTYKVLQSANCPIDNASTWLTWWSGDAIPRPTRVRLIEQLVPGSSRLLDLGELGSPAARHLFALDILNTKFRKSGRPDDFQRTRAELLVRTLNNAWAPFLNERPVADSSAFSLVSQVGPEEGVLRHPVLVTAAERDWVKDGGNLLRFAVPHEALLEHNYLEPTSIFRFLGLLATFNELDSPALLRMWALDFASAAMIFRTQLKIDPFHDNRQFPIQTAGRAGYLYMLAAYAFSAPERPGAAEFALHVASLISPDHATGIVQRLHEARSSYYATFARWGIPERTIRALNADRRNWTWDADFAAARAPF
jgi:hypothetical protein